ncbi:MAG: hypothetical protein ACFCGT_16110 [Sandaracinaceae bacterium]
MDHVEVVVANLVHEYLPLFRQACEALLRRGAWVFQDHETVISDLEEIGLSFVHTHEEVPFTD